MIHVVSTRPLQSTNPIADRQRRGNTYREMNVVLQAADGMKPNALGRNRTESPRPWYAK